MEKDDILGSWRLISLVATNKDGGKFLPFGDSPTGMIMYEPGGYMFYIAMRSERGKFESGDVLGGTAEEKIAAFDSFDAYNGTYEVNLEEQVIIHTVEASRSPDWSGTKQVRHFRLEGTRLVIETPPIQTRGSEWVIQVVFERLNGS
jgi:hypothetical protein